MFKEEELQLSHDVPKYAGGTDQNGRHFMCKNCHREYEIMTSIIIIKSLAPEGINEELKNKIKANARKWLG